MLMVSGTAAQGSKSTSPNPKSKMHSSLLSSMAMTNGIGTDQHNGHHMGPSFPENEVQGIRNVWKQNLYEEFAIIRNIAKTYTYIALDTEFPGVVARPIGEFRNCADYQYQTLRSNVDILALIQLGLTFMNEHGQTPPGTCTWQFNFKFSLTDDTYAQESIDLLTNAGIQFKKHETDGIDIFSFAEYFITSGFLCSDSITWLTFHSCYDFGYLIRCLMNQNLPINEAGFYDLLRVYFPRIFDVKFLMKSCKNLKGGLQEVADQLQIERVGLQHQAGSDSLVTGLTFFRMKELFFEDNIDESKYSGHLYGFGHGFSSPGLGDHVSTANTTSTTNTTTYYNAHA